MKRVIYNVKKRQSTSFESNLDCKIRKMNKKKLTEIFEDFHEKVDEEREKMDGKETEWSESEESSANESDENKLAEGECSDEASEGFDLNELEVDESLDENYEKDRLSENEVVCAKIEKNMKKPAEKFSNLQSIINFDELRNSDVIQVNCNSIIGELHKKKFGSGGKGSCIRVELRQILTEDLSRANAAELGSQSDEVNKLEFGDQWLTPIQFEKYCGKGNCRDWKKTIKVGGLPLLSLLENEVLIVHAVSCSCAACNHNEELVGPIRPFLPYSRRKKDEILAQNAFKKFLSLKPPALLKDKLISKFEIVPDLQPKTSLMEDDINLTGDSIKQTLDKNENVEPNLSKIMGSSEILSSKEISKKSYLNQNEEHSVEEILDLEEKKWTRLEQATNNLISQAQNLKMLIAEARDESRQNREILKKAISSHKKKRPKNDKTI